MTPLSDSCCGECRNGPPVEYGFKDIKEPIVISTYRLTRELPESLQSERAIH